jgi:2-polyprenyl-3-methyl-5-hydroxy-6-metoxy-1,4-benzoquinol methylase
VVADYRNTFYEKYVSAFKTPAGGMSGYSFSDSKLIPVLNPWVSGLSRDSRVLDLGCGHGSILHALRTLGFHHLEGVDLSAEQVAIARKEFPQVEHMALAEKLQSTHHSYDLIILFDVIEHLTKQELLNLFHLIDLRLASGGVLIVHTPNGDSPFLGPVRYGDFTHETVLTPLSARNLCELFGFSGFEAREHLGASASAFGLIRRLAWQGLRALIRACHLIETGTPEPRILTRNFSFKASKSRTG